MTRRLEQRIGVALGAILLSMGTSRAQELKTVDNPAAGFSMAKK